MIHFAGALILTSIIWLVIVNWRIKKITKEGERQLEALAALQDELLYADVAINEINIAIDHAEQTEEFLRLYVDSMIAENQPRKRQKVDWSKYGF
jgi:hypothetical protein